MLVLPLIKPSGEADFFIVLEDDNVKRITSYDPAEIYWDKFPPAVQKATINSVRICYAAPDEIVAMREAAEAGRYEETITLLRKLGRNFQYSPELGDGGEYQSLTREPIKPGDDSLAE